jgi:acetyl-CoA C-acetyltransferase
MSAVINEAVIVSTARTPLAKSFRGSFNMSHGAHLGGVVVRAALERARIEPGEVEDVIMGCANPEGSTGGNIARIIAYRAGCPATVAGTTVNRFCSSGLQTIALAAQRIMAGEDGIYVAGGVESISTVQPNRNQHMARDSWTVEHKPALYLPMLETAEIVGKRYGIPRERMDEYGVRSQTRACAADAAGHFRDEIIATPATMAVVGEDGRFATRDVVVERDEGLRADTTYEGVSKIRARSRAAPSPRAMPASSPTAREPAW